MSGNKWTPGPWETKNGFDIFGPLGGDSGDGCSADGSDGWQIAEVTISEAFVDGVLVEMGRGPAVANAHLIAAAPDLYEVLASFPGFYATPKQMAEWAVKCTKAEAKARGES